MAVSADVSRHSIQSDSPPGNGDVEWRVALIAISVFSLLSIVMADISVGFLEGDACSHFLCAKAAFGNLDYLVNVWGRPVCTGLYAIPAHFGGRLAVRWTSLAVAIAISLITRSIAIGQNWQWPTLALMFVLAQPLVFLHSFSELTELPFALLMAVGFLAYQRRQFFLLALVMGFAPLSRPEGFGFLILTFAALILHRRWWWTAVLLMPLLAWDYSGWHLEGEHGHWWRWLQEHWPYSQESLYEKGPLLYFIAVMPAVVSPFLFPATVVGAWLCVASTEPRSVASARAFVRAGTARRRLTDFFRSDHRRRCEILIAVLPLMILAAHSLLYWLGKMASNGEVRYMMVVAPFWGLLSARGWTWIFKRMDWKQPFLWASLAVTLPVLVNRAWTVLPMGTSPDWVEAEQIARWYKTTSIHDQYPYLDISHVGLQYALDFDPESGKLRPWTKAVIDSRPPGTLLIWDRVGALFNSDAQRKVPLDEIRRAGWISLKTRWTHEAGEWEFFVSEPPRIVKEPSSNSRLNAR